MLSPSALLYLHPGSVADHDGGENRGGDAGRDEAVRLLAGALPLVEDPAPHGAEYNDASHMERPAREPESAHLRLAHRIEEELQVPRRAGHRAEDIIAQHRDTRVRGGGLPGRMLDYFFARGVQRGFDDCLVLSSWKRCAQRP